MGVGHLQSEHIMGQTFSSSEYDNCRALTHVPKLMMCFIDVKKVTFEKKFGSSHWEISVSCTCTILEYDNVTTGLIIQFSLLITCRVCIVAYAR